MNSQELRALAERARVYAEAAVEHVDALPVQTVEGMRTITKAIADAFVMGYAASEDDRAPARALVDTPRSPAKRKR